MKVKASRIIRIILFIVLVWTVIAQSCMQFRISDQKAVSDFKEAGVLLTARTETINGHHLHYVSTGCDTLPILVFIHGSPGSWSVFERYLEDSDLLKHFQMVSVDRPGFGYSDYGKAQDLNSQSKIISPLLQHLKTNKPMYLVGHSLGGPIVVKLAYENAGLIDGLVILAGSVDPAEEKPERWRPVLSYSLLRYIIPGAMRQSNDELYYFKTDVLQMPDVLSKISCCVFIIHGDHDHLVPYANAMYAKEKLVNAKSVEITTLKGGDHFIPWTNYDDIKRALLQLIN
jgi:pimeloyl-ACP methyl ester carboxylesterase